VKADSLNPLLGPDSTTVFHCPVRHEDVLWEAKDVFNPTAVVKDGKVYLLYRAEDKVGTYAGTSRIGLAVSDDGIHFSKNAAPVLHPDNENFRELEWEGGCEDPRVVEDSAGNYVMLYTAFNGEIARLCVATSTNLVKWQKHGLAFGDVDNGALKDYWCKSGSVVTSLKNGRLIATKIRGKYWMYFGELDIFVATSDDLIHWTPEIRTEQMVKKLKYLGDSKYEVQLPVTRNAFKTALTTRAGHFDSQLVEPGPPAVLTDKGIVFIYNGVNNASYGDPAIAQNAYCGGQALFDPKDPSCLIARCSESFMIPSSEKETSGQTDQVNFLESLVYFNGKWITYFGMADSFIGMAVYDPYGHSTMK
jgi:beta-1,2-mannosidase